MHFTKNTAKQSKIWSYLCQWKILHSFHNNFFYGLFGYDLLTSMDIYSVWIYIQYGYIFSMDIYSLKVSSQIGQACMWSYINVLFAHSLSKKSHSTSFWRVKGFILKLLLLENLWLMTLPFLHCLPLLALKYPVLLFQLPCGLGH